MTRHFGIPNASRQRAFRGFDQPAASHMAQDTHANSSPDALRLASSRHQEHFPRVVSGGFSSELAVPGEGVSFPPSWDRQPGRSLSGARNETASSSDQEFAALCFSFGALVGLPLAIFSFVCGLLISFD